MKFKVKACIQNCSADMPKQTQPALRFKINLNNSEAKQSANNLATQTNFISASDINNNKLAV